MNLRNLKQTMTYVFNLPQSIFYRNNLRIVKYCFILLYFFKITVGFSPVFGVNN